MKTWFYDLRFNNCEWARIWITSDGMISICSDYGNYGYWFGAPGCEIRRFLARVDPGPDGYMAIKLAEGEREYDGDTVLTEVKKYILDHRRHGDMTREDAREEWDLLSEHGKLEHREEFHDWYKETKIDCAYEFYADKIPGQVQGFMEHCWPRLVEAMQKELDAESAFAEAFGAMQEMGV